LIVDYNVKTQRSSGITLILKKCIPSQM